MPPAVHPPAPTHAPTPPGAEATTAGLVLLASALVLIAPVLGRAGAPTLAAVAAVGAGLAGFASFLFVLVHSFSSLGPRPGAGPGAAPAERRPLQPTVHPRGETP